MSLLATRRFLPLFLTQFLGAFNDNLFKNALVMLVTYRLGSAAGMEPTTLVTVAAGIFILPFFLFSATAGQLADRYDRGQIARIVKLAEIALMLAAAAAFHLGDVRLLLAVLFGIGVHSSFFGPVKYALLPQHLYPQELLLGNAWIEAATFLAILLGTLGGGLLVLQPAGATVISVVTIGCALLGWLSSRQIPPAPPASPGATIDWNLPRATVSLLKEAVAHPALFRVILAISWFWLVGAVFLAQLPTLAKHTLNADETVVTWLLVLFSVGIGVGSFLCHAALKGRVSLARVPAAALLIALATADAGWTVSTYAASPVTQGMAAFLSEWQGVRLSLDLLLVAIGGGLYIVPLYSHLQEASPTHERARMIAANNIMNACFMVLAALGTLLLFSAGGTMAQLLALLALATGAVAHGLRKRA